MSFEEGKSFTSLAWIRILALELSYHDATRFFTFVSSHGIIKMEQLMVYIHIDYEHYKVKNKYRWLTPDGFTCVGTPGGFVADYISRLLSYEDNWIAGKWCPMSDKRQSMVTSMDMNLASIMFPFKNVPQCTALRNRLFDSLARLPIGATIAGYEAAAKLLLEAITGDDSGKAIDRMHGCDSDHAYETCLTSGRWDDHLVDSLNMDISQIANDITKNHIICAMRLSNLTALNSVCSKVNDDSDNERIKYHFLECGIKNNVIISGVGAVKMIIIKPTDSGYILSDHDIQVLHRSAIRTSLWCLNMASHVNVLDLEGYTEDAVDEQKFDITIMKALFVLFTEVLYRSIEISRSCYVSDYFANLYHIHVIKHVEQFDIDTIELYSARFVRVYTTHGFFAQKDLDTYLNLTEVVSAELVDEYGKLYYMFSDNI